MNARQFVDYVLCGQIRLPLASLWKIPSTMLERKLPHKHQFRRECRDVNCPGGSLGL
jgi:hypothetical protein